MVIDVIVDSREKEKDYFVGLLIDKGISPKIEALEAGDFLIYGKDEKSSTIIERKNADDFFGSVEGQKGADGSYKTPRLWDQLRRLKEADALDKILIIEGALKSRKWRYSKKWNPTRTMGALRAVQRWGIDIVHVPDKSWTIEYIKNVVSEKNKKKKEYTLRVSPPKSMTLKEKRLFWLQGFPGVGPVTSKKLLKEFKTIRNFLENIDKSNSLNKKQKEEISKIFG